ncbi:RYamide receptor-like [Oculina patagonica]
MNNSTHPNNDDFASCRHAVSIFFTTAMAIISSAAFIGNILVIVAVYKTPVLRTSTNYYYVNMAVSDFLVSLSIWPLYLSDEIITSRGSLMPGPLGLFGCKVGAYLRMVSQVVSILSLVLIAVDRFIATVYPLKARFITRKVRAVLLFATWLIPTAYCFPMFHYSTVGQKTFCTLAWNYLAKMIYYVTAAVIYNFAPLMAIIIIYSRIMQVLKKRTRPDNAARGNDLQRKRTEQNQNVMKIFKSIVATYFICLLPFGIYYILDSTITIIDKCKLILGFCDYVFPFLSTAINPIILFSCSTNFRHAFQKLCPFFHGKCRSCCHVSINQENVSIPELVSYKKTTGYYQKNKRTFNDRKRKIRL